MVKAFLLWRDDVDMGTLIILWSILILQSRKRNKQTRGENETSVVNFNISAFKKVLL